MRIGGMASGMDTEQIVRDLMRVQRMPIDKLNQNRQRIEWQRDAFRELNTMMSKFRDNIFDTVMRSANMAAKRVTSTNSSLVTATATAAAANGSFTISRVDQLASAATNVSQGTISKDGMKFDPTKSIASQKEFFGGNFHWDGITREETFTIVAGDQQEIMLAHKDFVDDEQLRKEMSVLVNGVSYTVVFDEGQELGENEVRFDRTVGSLVFATPLEEGSEVSVTYTTKSDEQIFTSSIKTFNSDGVAHTETFTFNGSMTFNQIMQRINNSSAGVSMFYDEFSDRVTVQRKQTGNFNKDGKEMTFEGNFFQNVLNLNTEAEKGGENAKFTINGLETERPANNFTINGVSFTLRGTFDGPPATLTVATDTDRIFDTIVGFVNEYNEMLEKINGKLREERHRDFLPLTDEQKEAMSDKDIERWEERAMSGLLRGDRTLSNGLDRMRFDLYSPVNSPNLTGDIRQLTDLGITTSRDFMERGKLEINEDKLRAAIERDPQGVFQLFTADGPTNAEKGLARRMRDGLQTTMRSVAERAGGSFGRMQNHQFTLGRNMNDIDSRISNMERRLQQVEDRYWRQFTAMEKAMHQAHSQADSLFSMLFANQM